MPADEDDGAFAPMSEGEVGMRYSRTLLSHPKPHLSAETRMMERFLPLTTRTNSGRWLCQSIRTDDVRKHLLDRFA